jgi:chromosome segregation ATPase
MPNIPKLPRYTCPIIDEVKEFLEEVQAYTDGNDFGATKMSDLSAMYELFADGVAQALENLERIRGANHDLRERQTYFEEQCENHEATVEHLQNEIEDLKEEIRTLT